jgi:hypothetical protein
MAQTQTGTALIFAKQVTVTEVTVTCFFVLLLVIPLAFYSEFVMQEQALLYLAHGVYLSQGDRVSFSHG